jgi:hypothetical protein
MLNKWLFSKIDNSALVVFRIIFGLLIALEAIGTYLQAGLDKALSGHGKPLIL